jgi:hypothetical protein
MLHQALMASRPGVEPALVTRAQRAQNRRSYWRLETRADMERAMNVGAGAATMVKCLGTLAAVIALAGCATSPPRVATPPPSTPPAAPAVAAMQFYMPDPNCAVDDPSCIRFVYGIGEITTDTPRLFAAVFAANGDTFATTAGLVLDSPGGNLVGGLLLGDAIRRAGINTIVGYTYRTPRGTIRTASCISACAWAFAGGVNRLMLADSSLGVHRFYGTDSVASAQEVTAYVNLYLDRMGVSRVLQDVASLTPANEMAFLTIADAVRFDLAYLTPAAARAAGLTGGGRTARRR